MYNILWVIEYYTYVKCYIQRFCEEDIDQILEQRAHVVQLESEGKGSTFSKASFVADESSDINVDDPDFWQKWAERAKLNLDELANKVLYIVCTALTCSVIIIIWGRTSPLQMRFLVLLNFVPSCRIISCWTLHVNGDRCVAMATTTWRGR